MADNPQKLYHKLPGTGYQRMLPGWAFVALFFVIGIFVLLLRGRRVQLWQGKEHLLLVEWNGYREYYKRFNYRDIQAFVIRQTRERVLWNVLLALPLALCGFVLVSMIQQAFQRGFQQSGDVAVVVIFGTMSLVLLAGIIVNLALGPTCTCEIQTAVQTRPLPSLNRVNRARKVIARLRPLIEAGQGQLAPGELARLLDTRPRTPPPAEEAPPVIQTPVDSPVPSPPTV
jgi:hypothetical protein